MSDLISRQAAIDALDSIGSLDTDADRKYARGIFNALPSAEPGLKKGEWIPKFDGKFTGGAYWFSCSKCERIVPDVRNGGWNFCPNCGADMRGDEDE